MSEELLALAELALEGARPKESVEAFATYAQQTSVTAYDGEVETFTSAQTRGVGIRVVVGGRLGFAATADVSGDGLADALAEARSNAEFGTEDVGNVLPSPQPWQPLEGIFVAGLAAVPAERKVAFALELERATKAADSRVTAVSAASYGDVLSQVAVVSTTGVRAAYERTDAYASVFALARQDEETQTGFGLTQGRSIEELDLDAAAAEGAARATRLLGARKPPTATVPVVFDPFVAAQFLGAISPALSAEAVQKQLSFLADKLGSPVLTDEFSIVDDGRLIEGPAASPVDDEGVPSGRTRLVADGVLAGFLHNTETAARAGGEARSTGNATRGGHRSLPGVSPTNLFLDGPVTPVADVLRQAGDALYVQEIKGVHSGVNSVSGEFSVGATGLWLRGGELGEPVREITVSSTLLEMMRSIQALGDDRRFLPFGGAMAGATLLLGPMTVAGT